MKSLLAVLVASVFMTASSQPYKVIDVKGGGSITGAVRLQGETPGD